LQDPQRAVHAGDRVVVEDAQGQLSVFSADGAFLRRDRLPKGVWRGGMWSLAEYEKDLYMAIQDTDSRAGGLRATPNQSVVAELDSSFGIAQKFGTYPELYQNGEFVWRFTTLDISRDGLAAVGCYLVPDVQVYDVSQPERPRIKTIELDHPRFTEPEGPLPMGMPRSELQEHATDLSFVWQTYILSDRTVVQVFNNRTKAFYDNQAEEEHHHYAVLGTVGSDKQLALELPGRVFARDEKDRLYVELNPIPDERKIGIYEVNWP